MTECLGKWIASYYTEAGKAIRGIEECKLAPEYEHFFVEPMQWFQWSDDSRNQHLFAYKKKKMLKRNQEVQEKTNDMLLRYRNHNSFRKYLKWTSSTRSTSNSYTNQGSQDRSWWSPMGSTILIISNELFWGLLLITLENINLLIYRTEMLLVIFKIKNGYFQNLISNEQEIFSSHPIGFTMRW